MVEHLIVDFDIIFDSLGYIYEDMVMCKTSRMLRRPRSINEDDSWYIRIASSPYGQADGGATEHASTSMSVPFGRDVLRLNIPETRFDRSLAGAFKTITSQWVGNFTKWLGGKGVGQERLPRYQFVIVLPEREAVAEIVSNMANGKIRAVIQQQFPLHAAADAQKLLEEGHVTGKLVLVVNQTDV